MTDLPSSHHVFESYLDSFDSFDSSHYIHHIECFPYVYVPTYFEITTTWKDLMLEFLLCAAALHQTLQSSELLISEVHWHSRSVNSWVI